MITHNAQGYMKVTLPFQESVTINLGTLLECDFKIIKAIFPDFQYSSPVIFSGQSSHFHLQPSGP